MLNVGVTITSGPRDWQIIQRDERGMASITITGKWKTDEPVFFVQGRIVEEATGALAAKHLDWKVADIDLQKEVFELTFSDIPCGGLYRIETRLKRPQAGDKRAVRGDCIHHIGVGDIYIITGQSNASGTGKGSAADGPEFGVHLFANDEQWKIATHPLEDATATLHPITITSVFHGTSPWLAFGKRILNKTGVPIGLIPTALGGSLISMWVTDEGEPGMLFENMLDMFTKVGGKVAGVLWHQGESDTNPDGLVHYAERFHKLANLFRRTLHADIPIITAQTNSYMCKENPEEDARWSKMREIQRGLSREIPGVYMAVTLDCSMSDEIHNSTNGNVVVGERYADIALEHIYGLRMQSHFPEPEHIQFVDGSRNVIGAQFANVSGDWTPLQRCDDFTVEDEDGFVPIESVDFILPCEVIVRLSREAKGKTLLHGLYGASPRVTLRDDSCRCITAFSELVTDSPVPSK